MTKLTFVSAMVWGALAVSPPLPGQTPSTSPAPQTNTNRQVSWKLLPSNILNDQVKIWTFPAHVVQGNHLLPTATVLGTTAGLIAFDPTESSYFRSTSTLNGFNKIFSGNATAIGTLVSPLALYGAGLIRKDPKMQQTALFTGEAVADAEIVTTVLKDMTRRIRPATISADGNHWDTWFESGGTLFRGKGSFPSGHTIAVFSVATIMSRQYGKRHRWVPYTAYGLATLVGFSRLSLSAHFLSDVFLGGALGYSISRFTVLRQ